MLSERETEVLGTIIEQYVSQAVPVGSRTVARASQLGLSPASIRNVMADLTDKGFLDKPHTSAGRVPTPMAFRFYLDQMLSVSQLSETDKRQILASLGETGPEVSDILRRAGQVLSAMSGQISMVLAPLNAGMRLLRVEFVRIRPELVLVVLVLEGEIIQKRLITLDKPVSADDLVRYANYLNDLFAGHTMTAVRAELMQEMVATRQRLSESFQVALVLLQQTMDAEGAPQLFVDGALNMLSQPEFSTLSTIRELMELLEDQAKLLGILGKVMDAHGVLVTLGDENQLASLPGCSLIASPYTVTGQALGVIGVIGPMRMNYANVVPVVDYTAQTIAKILGKRF